MTIQRINNGKGHWYKIDGDKADGVTKLIGDGLAKPALINWAANTTAEYAVDNWADLTEKKPSERIKELKAARYADRDSAARRGTEVHKIAEQLIHGGEVEVPDEIAGHVDSYVRFLDEWKPQPILVETTVASRQWKYCGTLDGVLRFPDGTVRIADIKTSRSGIYGEASLQLAAYAHADVWLDQDGVEQKVSDLGITEGIGIWIRGDGYDVYPLDISDRAYRFFLHVAWVARQAKTLDGLKGEPMEVPA